MAIASGGTLGTGVSSTSTSSFTLATATNTLSAGDTGILTVVSDNISTSDGSTNDHTSVTGGTGTWTKLGEYTNAPSASAAVGVTTSLWMFVASGAVNTGTTITINLSGASVDKCASFWKFTSTNPLVLTTGTTNPITSEVTASNGFGSSAFSGLSNIERLYVRGLGKEANTTTALTVSSGFAITTANRSRNNASAVIVRGEWDILTGTGATSNPTLAVSGDTAGLFAALEEQAPIEMDAAISASATVTADLSILGARTFAENFGGPTSYLYTATLPSAMAGDFTHVVWVKPQATARGMVLSFDNTSGDELLLGMQESGGVIYWYSYAAGVYNTLTSTVVDTSGWYPAGIRRSGTTISVWVDGVSILSQSGTLNVANADFTVGARKSAGGIENGSQFHGDIAQYGCWDRALSDAEMLEMATSAYSPAMYPTDLVAHYEIDGTASPEPDNKTANTLAVTGAPSTSGPNLIAATVLGTAPITGSATVTGALSTSITAAASIAGTGAVTGALSTSIRAAGALSGTGAVTGALTTSIHMAAGVSGSATSTAALTTAITMAGALSADAVIAAEFVTDASIAGALAGAATVTGALSTSIRAAAGVTATATVTGALTTSITLARGLSGSAAVTGALTTSITLASAVTATATPTAALTTSIPLVASLSASGSVAGALTTSITLTAPLTASGSLAGALTTSITLASALSGSAVLSGTLAIPAAALAAAVTARATTTADLRTREHFDASISASARLVGILAGTTVVNPNSYNGPPPPVVVNPDRTQPFAQWHYVDVYFPLANTDVVVAHNLSPPTPEHIHYMVTRAAQACSVYHDVTAARRVWQNGHLVLRSSVPNAQVTLLLSVEHAYRTLPF